MEIFGVGLPEIMLIAIVALIILGPERMPEAARTVGKGIADFRKAIEPARSAWRDISGEFTSATMLNGNGAAKTPIGSSAPGNPYEVHPVLQMMDENEREVYMQGGEMPQHVSDQLATDLASSLTPGSHEAVELPHLDYGMPHTTLRFEPAPRPQEELSYPAPGYEPTPTPEPDQPLGEQDPI